MRLFLGFPADNPTQTCLKDWQMTLRHPSTGFRWLSPSIWHITALFIGSIPDSTLSKIISAIPTSSSPFSLVFDHFRILKQKGLTTMLWAQYQPCDALTNLHQSLHHSLQHIAPLAPPQQKITPHITLARVKTKEYVYPIEWQESKLPILPCNTLHLYRSHLQSTGATYERLATFLLNG